MSPIIRSLHSAAPLQNAVKAIPPSRALSSPLSHSSCCCKATTSYIYRVITARSGLSSPQLKLANTLRPFSTTPLNNKSKKGKESASSNTTAAAAAADDPFEFAKLEKEIKDAIDRLKDNISKARAGGRVNAEVIEGMLVSLGKNAKDKVRLGELAQVIPKGGRAVTILMGEEAHMKPITSTLASSSHSLNPQPDPHNPLQLSVPIPPPTKESRDQAVKDAKAAMEKASNAVRNSRGDWNKKLNKEKKNVRPDDLRKAMEQMEKIAAKGQKDVKEVFETAKKALEKA